MTNQPEPSLKVLLDELEDAIWCSRGDDITQNTAAKNRAVKARADILHRVQADKETAVEEAYNKGWIDCQRSKAEHRRLHEEQL